MCATTPSYVDSFILDTTYLYVTSLIYVWHDYIVRDRTNSNVPWLIHTDMTYSAMAADA